MKTTITIDHDSKEMTVTCGDNFTWSGKVLWLGIKRPVRFKTDNKPLEQEHMGEIAIDINGVKWP